MEQIANPCQIRVYDQKQLVYTMELDRPAELGRQSDRNEVAYSHQIEGDHYRVVIARLDEPMAVSRKHVRLEPLPGGKIRLTNLSKNSAVRLEQGRELKPDTSLEMALPVVFTLGTKTVRVQEIVEEEDVPLQGLAEATLAPALDAAAYSSRIASLAPIPRNGAMDAESLIRWMRVTMEVLQSATGSLEFFSQAARAVVDLVGLDAGRVLLLEKGNWELKIVQAREKGTSDALRPPSRQVLSKVQQEKRTFWQTPSSAAAASLVGVDAVVAAPILNRNAEVIGVLYGDRSALRDGGPSRPISKLEAMLVELLAGGVAAGLARVEQEQAAVRAQVQFEQFFTPELARELAAHPELLSGQDLEITVLFCDIRGFSRITERLGATRTVEWINDVMGALSKCVLDQGGVLADYIGDELLAMFGAPVACDDHAARACRAALAMREVLPKLQDHWLSVVQERMGIGIGINTGIARVGNIGSVYKFKYGAIGNTVNLASRVQGATKYLKAPILITEATQKRLGENFASRRLCPIRVVNIEQPVALYELADPLKTGWQELKRGYEEALAYFEQKQFVQVVHALGKLLLTHPDDGPSLVLMFLAVSYLREEPSRFEAVWELPGK